LFNACVLLNIKVNIWPSVFVYLLEFLLTELHLVVLLIRCLSMEVLLALHPQLLFEVHRFQTCVGLSFICHINHIRWLIINVSLNGVRVHAWATSIISLWWWSMSLVIIIIFDRVTFVVVLCLIILISASIWGTIWLVIICLIFVDLLLNFSFDQNALLSIDFFLKFSIMSKTFKHLLRLFLMLADVRNFLKFTVFSDNQGQEFCFESFVDLVLAKVLQSC